MSLDADVKRWLKSIEKQVERLRSFQPFTLDDEFIDGLKKDMILADDRRNTSYWRYAQPIWGVLDSLYHNQPEFLALTSAEKRFFQHDISHVIRNVGIMLPHAYDLRKSTEGFLYAFAQKESPYPFLEEMEEKNLASLNPDNPVPKISRYYELRTGRKLDSSLDEHAFEAASDLYWNDVRTTKENISMYQKAQRRHHMYHCLYDDKTLRNALSNWYDNFIDSCDSRLFLWSYLAERKMFRTTPCDLERIFKAVRGQITNDFFALTQSSTTAKVGIECHCDPGIIIEQPGLIHSIIYNLAKNAMKQAEILYADRLDFTGGKIILEGVARPDGTRFCVAQTFDGIDQKAYARLGYSMVSGSHPLAEHMRPGAVSRYEAWIDSSCGERYGDMKIKDITDLVFVPYISGARIDSSKTSGLGLFGLRQGIIENGGTLKHFYKPVDEETAMEGFMVRMPHIGQRTRKAA